MSNNEIVLSLAKEEAPDTVQSLRWFVTPDKQHYLAEGKWSGQVNVHDVQRRGADLKFSFSFDGPVTAVEWFSDGVLFAGYANGQIVAIDLKDGRTGNVVSLNGFILKMRAWRPRNDEPEMLIIGMADDRIVLLRPHTKEVKEVKLSKKMAAFDFVNGTVAVALEDESYFVCPLEVLMNKEPSSKSITFKDKHRTTGIALNPHDETVLLSSTGGELKEFKLKEVYNTQEFSLRDSNDTSMITAIEYCMDPQTKIKFSATVGGQLKLWASTNSSVPKMVKEAPKNGDFEKPELTAASWSPSGDYIAYSVGNSWNHGIYSLIGKAYQARTYIYAYKN